MTNYHPIYPPLPFPLRCVPQILFGVVAFWRTLVVLGTSALSMWCGVMCGGKEWSDELCTDICRLSALLEDGICKSNRFLSLLRADFTILITAVFICSGKTKNRISFVGVAGTDPRHSPRHLDRPQGNYSSTVHWATSSTRIVSRSTCIPDKSLSHNL